MIIKIKECDLQYHIASFTKNEDILKEMLDKNYTVAYLKDNNLTLYPMNKEIILTNEEKKQLSKVADYSIFEMTPGNVYIYYDASSLDNALFITNRCNSNCIMCPVSSIVRKNDPIENISTLLKIGSQIPNDSAHITITGGEPFLLRKDIFTLFQFLKDHLNSVEYLLLTNARALSNKEYFELFRQTIPDNLLVGIPIHGSNEKRHDTITRAKGSFKQTMMALHHLMSTHIRVEIRIVVSQLNIDDLQQIAQLIIKECKRVYTVKFIGLEMLGNARRNLNDVWIDYKESFLKMKSAIDLLVKNEIDVGIYNYPLCCVDQPYWSLCEKSITDYKVRYLPQCNQCTKKDACGGMFSGTYNLMKGVIEPIL